jgi:hypothetical protein
MIMSDARVPVVYGALEDARAGDAVVFEGEVRPFAGAAAGFVPGLRHVAECSCCAGRSEAGRALGALLHARARSEVPFFKRVVVVAATEAGRVEVANALLSDPIASTCFRQG